MFSFLNHKLCSFVFWVMFPRRGLVTSENYSSYVFFDVFYDGMGLFNLGTSISFGMRLHNLDSSISLDC